MFHFLAYLKKKHISLFFFQGFLIAALSIILQELLQKMWQSTL